MPKPWLFDEDKLSIAMISISALFVLLVAIMFELMMPTLPHIYDFKPTGLNVSGDPSLNFIVYVVSSSLHIVLTLFFSIHLWRGVKQLSSIVNYRPKKYILISASTIISAFIIAATQIQPKIVSYSHERTLSVFSGSNWDGFLAEKIPLTNDCLFSLYPAFLVICGVIFSVISCVWSASKAVDIANIQLRKTTFDKDSIWSDISVFGIIISSVFLTSTVATTSYLNLGRELTSPDGYGRFYRDAASGMSILWAVCFSLIMIVIVLYPMGFINKSIRVQIKENRVLGRDTERFSLVYGALSTGRLLQLLAVLFTPVYVATLRVTIG